MGQAGGGRGGEEREGKGGEGRGAGCCITCSMERINYTKEDEVVMASGDNRETPQLRPCVGGEVSGLKRKCVCSWGHVSLFAPLSAAAATAVALNLHPPAIPLGPLKAFANTQLSHSFGGCWR